MQATGNENVPIQLVQCWYPGLASSKAKILMFLKIKYTEAILPTALGNCYGLKIPKC